VHGRDAPRQPRLRPDALGAGWRAATLRLVDPHGCFGTALPIGVWSICFLIGQRTLDTGCSVKVFCFG
jgi:hypothetical protein